MTQFKHLIINIGMVGLMISTHAVADGSNLYPNLGAEHIGMGSAYVASVQGPIALLGNPAGMMARNHYAISFNLGVGSSYSEQYIGGCIPVGSKWTIGMGLHRGALKSVEGDSIGLLTGIASELIKDELTMGASIQGFVSPQSVQGVRLSIGMQYKPHPIITLGTSVASRGAFNNDAGTTIRIPFHAKTGFQLRPYSSLSINMDAELARKDKQRAYGELARVNYGIEWQIPIQLVSSGLSEKVRLYARGGTRSGIIESKDEGAYYTWNRPWGENGLSFGLGIIFSSFNRPICINFAADEYSRSFLSIQTLLNQE